MVLVEQCKQFEHCNVHSYCHAAISVVKNCTAHVHILLFVFEYSMQDETLTCMHVCERARAPLDSAVAIAASEYRKIARQGHMELFEHSSPEYLVFNTPRRYPH